MIKNYRVYGTAIIDQTIYLKERLAILAPLLKWAPGSLADKTYTILAINSSTIGIAFDDADNYQENVYYGIRDDLVKTLEVMKNKYPEEVRGQLFITSEEDYTATRIDLDEEKFYHYELQRVSKPGSR